MSEGIVVVEYDEAWPDRFDQLGTRLRTQLGSVALRIDHIGSTAVPGLAAKAIIDVQISVEALEPVDLYRARLERAGFEHRADNPERTKRYFREQPGHRRTHIHVRRAGSFSEQFALLFRDFLRSHGSSAEEYAELKRSLADRFPHPHQRHDYVEAKAPFIWATLRRADEWAQEIGWEPPPSDC